uniref:Homeobox-leucine zipper protein HOX3 n=1 Tax=Aegilops tauschii TaxID=37682 RepID=M8CDX3_AEGTA
MEMEFLHAEAKGGLGDQTEAAAQAGGGLVSEPQGKETGREYCQCIQVGKTVACNWTKLKHTEMECEYLKRCFGSLTEENRRLQREVEELRAMRMAPPTVLSPHTRQPLPASALTMCPRCERVTAATGPRITRPAASPFHPRRPSAAF